MRTAFVPPARLPSETAVTLVELAAAIHAGLLRIWKPSSHTKFLSR